MKFNRCICIIAAVFLIAMSCLATADRLPREVPENQVFTISSIIEAVGAVNEKTSTVWQIGDKGLTTLPNATGNANGDIVSGSIAYATYTDSIITNGGQISEVKAFSLDTQEKTAGLFNIETTKVLTYTSQNGSHLMGEESYVLDVAGNWSRGDDSIVCVFSKVNKGVVPAFCNKVTASSKLTSITTAQVETQGGMTVVGKSSAVPAALKYEISVTPDANSASGYADGIVSTTFTVSIMEGRTGNITTGASAVPLAIDARAQPNEIYRMANFDTLAATLTHIDTATVAGGISTFNKAFNYQSGIACTNC
jgi:hypothetical protein